MSSEPLRKYRAQSRVMGQTSPPLLGLPALSRVVGKTVADIGCGSGIFGYMMRAAWQWTASWQEEATPAPRLLVGVDWSPQTVALLRSHGPYDQVEVGETSQIPLGSNSVDTALSVENLEHLPRDQVAAALLELQRISVRRIVVTTPAPWAAVNLEFLTAELAEAQRDPNPMGHSEYLNLVGQLHLSSVAPNQMEAAGFLSGRNRLGVPYVVPGAGSCVYVCEPDRLDVTPLYDVLGLDPKLLVLADDGREDWRAAYGEVVGAALAIPAPRRPPPRRRVSALLSSLRDGLTID